MPPKNRTRSYYAETLRQIERLNKKAARNAVKSARVILRRLKVGLLPDLWNEVLATASRSSGDELAAAYLIALGRRFAAQKLATPFLDPDVRATLARRMLNHQRRLDGKTPLPEIAISAMSESATALPQHTQTPKALPAAKEQPPAE